MALALSDAKTKIFDYVESRMYFLAPNVTHICGPATAAKLMGAAGGLVAMSRMPASNLMLVGKEERAAGGMSSAATLKHTGIIYYSELVQAQPPEYRMKAARLVANKVTLAARVDAYQEERGKGATSGLTMREDILTKLVKAQEPAPAKLVKALPAPDMDTKKKRGGKRARSQKERYTLSDARKAANRITFGQMEEDVYQEEMGFSLGALGKDTAGGQFRMPDARSKKKGGTITKKMQRRLAQEQARGAASIFGDGRAGTASAISYTPVQGLELIRTEEKKAAPGTGSSFFGTASFDRVAKKAREGK